MFSFLRSKSCETQYGILTKYLVISVHIDGSVQERRNSIAKALELRLSCTNPSTCLFDHDRRYHSMQRCWAITWWRHQMETFSAQLAICAGNSPVPHKGQWRGALMFSLICIWINSWVNNREAGDLRRHRGHYDVNVMNNPRKVHAIRHVFLQVSMAFIDFR